MEKCGRTEGQRCSTCGIITIPQESIAPVECDTIAIETMAAVTATCQIEGFTAERKCPICNNVTQARNSLGKDANNHNVEANFWYHWSANHGFHNVIGYYSCCQKKEFIRKEGCGLGVLTPVCDKCMQDWVTWLLDPCYCDVCSAHNMTF